MKKRISLISALTFLCVISVFCSSCSLIFGDEVIKVSTRHSSVVFDFEHLWNMEFPEEFSPAFVYYARGGWMGEGSFYAIYECEQPNEEFLKDFSEDMNGEVKEEMSVFNYYYENREKIEEEKGVTLTIESAHLPDWEKAFISVAYHKRNQDSLYIGKDNCEEYCDEHLYMCYFPDTKMLYIREDIT